MWMLKIPQSDLCISRFERGKESGITFKPRGNMLAKDVGSRGVRCVAVACFFVGDDMSMNQQLCSVEPTAHRAVRSVSVAHP